MKNVSASFGKQIRNSAILAIIVSLLLIVVYISLRFQWKFSVPVIVALLHDVLITVGLYALVGREVTTATVAAILTVLGYSIYDTIIIFDRIRENIPLMKKAPFRLIGNVSLWETIPRSLATTFITLLPIVSLLLFGGDTLKDFAFALLVGIAAGAYSSIGIAAPLLAMLKEREPEYARRRDEEVCARRHPVGQRRAARGPGRAGAQPAAPKRPRPVRARRAGRARRCPRAPRWRARPTRRRASAAVPGARTARTAAPAEPARPACAAARRPCGRPTRDGRARPPATTSAPATACRRAARDDHFSVTQLLLAGLGAASTGVELLDEVADDIAGPPRRRPPEGARRGPRHRLLVEERGRHGSAAAATTRSSAASRSSVSSAARSVDDLAAAGRPARAPRAAARARRRRAGAEWTPRAGGSRTRRLRACSAGCPTPAASRGSPRSAGRDPPRVRLLSSTGGVTTRTTLAGRPRARRLREMLDELGPTFVKFGQVLSTRPDVVPPDIVAELRKLQDDVAAGAVRAGARAGRELTSASPSSRHSSSSTRRRSPPPRSARCTGPCCRTGVQVAVKVQRPGAPRQIDADLQLMRAAARIVKERVHALDFIDTERSSTSSRGRSARSSTSCTRRGTPRRSTATSATTTASSCRVSGGATRRRACSRSTGSTAPRWPTSTRPAGRTRSAASSRTASPTRG